MFKFFRPAWTLMWYVSREFMITFLLTALGSTIFLLLMISFTMTAELSDFGVDVTDIMMLAPFIVPRALTIALPLATLIATVMVFGRMTAENEILAAQAGGAAIRRIVWPLILCGMLISCLSLWLQDTGMRWGNDTIRSQVLKLNKPQSFLTSRDKPGGTLSIHPDPNKYTRINILPTVIDEDGKEWRPIQIVNFLNAKVEQTVLAQGHDFMVAGGDEGGTIDRMMSINLKNVQTFGLTTNTADEIVMGVQLPDIAAMIPIGNTRGQKGWSQNRADAIKIAEDEHKRWEFMLRRASDFGAIAASSNALDPAAPGLIANGWNDTKLHAESINGQGGSQDRGRQDWMEFHRKIALSILPISMIFLGVGLGLLVRKSNRLIGILLGIVAYMLLYYPLTLVVKTLSTTGNWEKMSRFCPPQYLPNVLLLVLGYAIWRLYERGVQVNLGAILNPRRIILELWFQNYDKWPAAIRTALRTLCAVIAVIFLIDIALRVVFLEGSPFAAFVKPGGGPDFQPFYNMVESKTARIAAGILLLLALPDVCRFAWTSLKIAFRGFMMLVSLPIHLFMRRTTDIYIGSAFLMPLLVVILSFAGLITLIDSIDHLTEIIDGIRHAAEPLGTLPVRTSWEAVCDAFAYYGIVSLEFTLNFLPMEVLLAGLLCGMVLVRNQEHLILKSSGVRLQRAMRPVIFLALLACGSVTLIRELWMPELSLHRDFLKPQVYRRNSQPTSLALYTLDENKKPLLFEMGQYNSVTKIGREMHTYLLGEQRNRRIPLLVADIAKWNPARGGWDLFTDPAVQEQRLLEQAAGPFSGGGGGGKEKDRDKNQKGKPKVAGAKTGTVTTEDFEQPATSANVTIAVENSAWMSVGDVVYILGAGYYSVVATPSTPSVTVRNLGYAGGAETGSIVRAGAVMDKPKEIPGGQRCETDNPVDLSIARGSQAAANLPPIAVHKSRVDFWQGPINPKFIDGDRLGVTVMRLNELRQLSEYKADLMVEWYKRVSEFMMGALLLWCALPLILGDSTRSMVSAILSSIGFAAIYWAMNAAAVKLAIAGHGPIIGQVPLWTPLIPHAIFLVIGFYQFHFRMET